MKPKGKIQKRSGPKRPRNPKVLIPLENEKALKRISQVYLESLKGQEEKHIDASLQVFIWYKY